MVATSISAVVLIAIFSAYLFMGRNLTRLVNLQRQEVQSRAMLQYFTRDLSAATQVSIPATGELLVTKPAASGTTTVRYVYSAADGTVVRREGADQKLLSSLTSFSYAFYNESGTAVASSALQSVKAIELSFSSAYGSASAGTLARYTTVSPRVVLRNRPLLQ